MDRERIIAQIKEKGISVGSKTLKIESELGSGGNGVALLCNYEKIKNLVVKVYIPPDSRDLDENSSKRFKNEIALISKIKHPNIVQALDSGTIHIGAYGCIPVLQDSF